MYYNPHILTWITIIIETYLVILVVELIKRSKRKRNGETVKVKKSSSFWAGIIALGILGIIFVAMLFWDASIQAEKKASQTGLSEIAKPVIYIYPEKDGTEFNFNLKADCEITCEYPEREDGKWTGTADKDGTLHINGKDYYCLYWEGQYDADWDFSSGYCIQGRDTAEFLEKILKELGMTERESEEFIIYWLPQMQDNRYNVISFQTKRYEEAAKLEVTPEPDTVIRVFMAWYSSEEEIEITPQTLTAQERTGFTVVEWGGSSCASK